MDIQAVPQAIFTVISKALVDSILFVTLKTCTGTCNIFRWKVREVREDKPFVMMTVTVVHNSRSLIYRCIHMCMCVYVCMCVYLCVDRVLSLNSQEWRCQGNSQVCSGHLALLEVSCS